MILPKSLLIASLATISLASTPPSVQIGHTNFLGRDITGLKLDFFGGIPYAEPPVGPLRLKPPVLKTRLNVSTFDASNYGYSCLQAPTDIYPLETLNEDCLSINVLRPSNLPTNASLPVLFWTYGGGFYAGASSPSLYNASQIVAQSVSRGTPIIYVSFNYRLGPLGWPQGYEAGQRKALNLGLRDQLAALEWVQRNIGFFGGDKDKVTVFGESAGSMMTHILYLNSLLPKYARGAIFESGSAATPFIYGPSRRQEGWNDFVAGVPGCSSSSSTTSSPFNSSRTGRTFNCLQSATSTSIFQGLLHALAQASEEFPFVPTLDGPGGLYPEYPSKQIEKGQFARRGHGVPFVCGTNLDEGTLLIPPYLSTNTQLKPWLRANFSPPTSGVTPSFLNRSLEKIFQLYPDDPEKGSPYGTGNDTFGRGSTYKRAAAILGDIQFLSQRRAFQDAATRFGVRSYGYLFTEPTPEYVQAGLGVAHGTEVAFVYGYPPSTPTGKFISAMMMDYWISFVVSLDPNDWRGISRPKWDEYTLSNQAIIQLNGANVTMIPDDFRREENEYLNSIPEVLHH